MLKEKAQEIFRFVVRFAHEHGYPPTVREIGEEFAISSTNGVRHYLGVLEREGYLRRNNRISRGLEVPETGLKRFVKLYGDVGGAEVPSGIPILGRVAAGAPLLASENLEGSLDLEESFPGREPRFALRVRGDSMKDAGILENDLVVVRGTDHADDGDIVVALLGDEATVKTLRRLPDAVELLPANQAYRPIRVEQPEGLRILGVVVGLVRPAGAARARRRAN